MSLRYLALVLSLLAPLCSAAPFESGLSFDKRAGALPTLTLPYGTYQAKSYNANGDVSSRDYAIKYSIFALISDSSTCSRISDLQTRRPEI